MLWLASSGVSGQARTHINYQAANLYGMGMQCDRLVS